MTTLTKIIVLAAGWGIGEAVYGLIKAARTGTRGNVIANVIAQSVSAMATNAGIATAVLADLSTWSRVLLWVLAILGVPFFLGFYLAWREDVNGHG